MMSEGFTENSIKNSKGSVNPYINWKDLANYVFLLPPKDQQAKLAELLWAMDEVVESELRIAEKLNQMKSALQRKYYNSLAYDSIPIQNNAKVYSGATPSRKISKYWNGSIPWIKTAEVNYNVITQTAEHITEEGLNNSSTKLIPIGSLLIAMYGQGVTRGRVAMTGIEATCNQACAVIECNDESYINHVYHYLEYKYEDLRSLAHGANQQNLSLAMIKNFPIPNFKSDLRRIVLSEFKQIVESFTAIDKKVESSKNLQKSLINDVF
ncbi:hypothetical protein ZORO111903_09140 [Zobellia roscoffensis]